MKKEQNTKKEYRKNVGICAESVLFLFSSDEDCAHTTIISQIGRKIQSCARCLPIIFIYASVGGIEPMRNPLIVHGNSKM